MSNPVTISLSGSKTIGEVDLDTDQITGEGGPADPRLKLPLKIMLYTRPAGAMLALTELACSLHSKSPTFENNQIGPTMTVNLKSGFPFRGLPGTPSPMTQEVRFRLGQAVIAQFERQRLQQVDHAFYAYLRLQPTVAWLRQEGDPVLDEPGASGFPPQQKNLFTRLDYCWDAKIGDLAVQVPASVWVQQVLPGLGYDQLRLVEIALPVADGLLPTEIIGYYDAARRHFDLGNYRDAIAGCRDVRNAVERHLAATPAHRVGDVVADRLGLAVDAPQRAILNATWEALRLATNAAHHIPAGPRLMEADARMSLHLTAILLEYIAQLR